MSTLRSYLDMWYKKIWCHRKSWPMITPKRIRKMIGRTVVQIIICSTTGFLLHYGCSCFYVYVYLYGVDQTQTNFTVVCVRNTRGIYTGVYISYYTYLCINISVRWIIRCEITRGTVRTAVCTIIIMIYDSSRDKTYYIMVSRE